jgi:UDP-N-acetyl-2-amino-2-deoxyglucuronate dehydrogenase
MDGQEIEFSEGFTDLHTLSYQQIVQGNGFGLEDVRPSIELVSQIRTSEVRPRAGEVHPFLQGATNVVERYRRGWPV